MKSMPQHACDECNEMVQTLDALKQRVSAAKRLPTLEQMQNELAALQLDLGGVITKAREMKTFVCAAFVTTHTREHDDARPTVPMFPQRLEHQPDQLCIKSE